MRYEQPVASANTTPTVTADDLTDRRGSSATADVHRIAVLRASAIGDFVFALPALEALKRRFPSAELVYLGKSWHRDFLEGRPGPVDRVVVVPRCRGVPQETDRVGNPAEVAAFFERMRDEHFDLAFQMHGGGANSNPFVRSLGAGRTIGFQAEGAPPLDVNIPYFLYQPEVLRYLELAECVGASPATLQPQLAVTEADFADLDRQLPNRGQRHIVLHPGASDVRRRWSPAKFAAVGDTLADAGYTVYITGGGDEKALADKVVTRMRNRGRNIAGMLSLRALAALLHETHLVITNDTGPLHLARAVGTITIGIYWMGNVITGGPVRANGNRICVAWETHCPRCGMDCVRGDAHQATSECDHAVSFVNSIEVDAVLEHADRLLNIARTENAVEAS